MVDHSGNHPLLFHRHADKIPRPFGDAGFRHAGATPTLPPV
jgi:hypothetical protein